MYATQIHRILSNDNYAGKHFTGVFPADHLPPIKKETAFIVNTDTHDQNGSHWLAMFIQDKNTLEFFDSFGLPPSTYHPFISQYASQFKHVKWNETSFQSPTSNVCGQYCTYYLLKRCNGFSMEYVLHVLRFSKNNDFILYKFFKKKYAVNMIFKK